jgi:3-phenylpropionate/cinnamic acid dioxygenase small subunit
MTSEETLRELVDRAEISKLLHAYARTLDRKDWKGNAETYVPDGRLELFGEVIDASDLAAATEERLGEFYATHHISANHEIQVAADTATAHSYFQATHVARPDSRDHWTVAGWYDSECQRTDDGWRFTVVRLNPVWQTGPAPAWV